MSNSLTNPAPADDTAATSVEDTAPVAGSEVEDGSEPGENTVPAERFNGLMSSFNEEKQRADSAEARIAALEEKLNEAQLSTSPEPKEGPVTEPTTDPRIDQLMEQMQELTATVGAVAGYVDNQSTAELEESVFEEFPEAAAFKDLIIADTPDGYREMAQEIANRIRGPQENSEGEGSVEPAPASGGNDHPLVEDAAPGGGPPVDLSNDPGDRASQAIEAGNWDDWMAAKAEEAGATDSLVLAE